MFIVLQTICPASSVRSGMLLRSSGAFCSIAAPGYKHYAPDGAEIEEQIR
jgi:hypothetical protein